MADVSARRYRLLDRIAVGGTAEVYKALYVGESGTEDTPVVIKRILPQLASDERFRVLFQEEARLASALTHPNIVKVLDFGDLDDTCFIAMEQIDGYDLGTLLRTARHLKCEPPVPPPLAAFIAAEVGAALQFIHRRTSSKGTPLHIIHRDVSPQNILIANTGAVKLTDFGIAKSVIRREHTVDGTLRGKLEYMAPEQALPDGVIDHKTDLFALGCVLYEMLNGASPLHAGNEIETLQRIREMDFRAASETLRAPAVLKPIVSRLLRRAAGERYDAAEQMVTALKSYLEETALPDPAVDLANWANELGRTTPPAASDAADAAVRALLGHTEDSANIDIASIAPELIGTGTPTSVFAVSKRGADAISAASKSTPTEPMSRALGGLAKISIVILTAIGVLGWLLLGVRVARDPELDTGRKTRTQQTRQQQKKETTKTTQLVPEAPRPQKNHASDRPAQRTAGSLKGNTTAAETGKISINSLPWSAIYLDGKFIDSTPIVQRPIPAGDHWVQLRDTSGSLLKAFKATVLPGKTRVYSFDFAKASDSQ